MRERCSIYDGRCSLKPNQEITFRLPELLLAASPASPVRKNKERKKRKKVHYVPLNFAQEEKKKKTIHLF